MGFKRGDVHWVNFNPSKGTEAGKIRPAVILQSNYLNDKAACVISSSLSGNINLKA